MIISFLQKNRDERPPRRLRAAIRLMDRKRILLTCVPVGVGNDKVVKIVEQSGADHAEKQSHLKRSWS